MKKIRPSYEHLFLISFIFPVAHFMLSPGFKSYATTILVTYLVSLLICIKRPEYIIPSYLLFLIISPLWFNFWGVTFWIINVIPLSYLMLYFYKNRLVRISNNTRIIIVSIFSIFTISMLFSPQKISLFPGFIHAMVLVIMILLSSDYINKYKNFKLIEHTIIYAGVIISLLVITAFLNKINLGDYFEIASGQGLPSRVGYFFPKGTFFYTNIFFVSGISLIVAFSNLLVKKNKLWWLFLFFIIFVGFLVFFNKTAFFAMTISIIYCLFTCRQYISKITIIFFGILIYLSFISYTLFMLFDERTGNLLHLGGLKARFSILESILTGFDYYPAALFLGYGPESLVRVNHEKDIFIRLMKTSTNAVEGTLDSAILSYLVEYGVFFFALYLMIFAVGIFKGLKRYQVSAEMKNFENVPFYGGACFVYVFMCSFTQILSVGKIQNSIIPCWTFPT